MSESRTKKQHERREAPADATELEFEIDAAPAEIWRALVDPGALCGWFASEARVTPEVGGEYYVAHGEYGQSSVVEEIVDEERLRTSHGETLTEFILERRNRTTVLKIVQSGFGEPEQTSMASGWASYMQTLRHYLAHHAEDKAAATYLYCNAEGTLADVRLALRSTLPEGATVVDESERSLGAVIPGLGDGVYRASIEGGDGQVWLWVHLVAYGTDIAHLDSVAADVSAKLAQLSG